MGARRTATTMISNRHDIDRAFDVLTALVREDPELSAELEESRSHFFRRGEPHGDRRTRDLAARRHLEWFLLERESPSLRAVPIEALLKRDGALAGQLLVEDGRALTHSHCSVFEVTDVDPGNGVWLKDLVCTGAYAIAEPRGSQLLRAGDVIAGRVFPLENAVHHVSGAASFFRNPQLLAALQDDLKRARASRRGVLRLTQDQIESMFYGADGEEPAKDAVGDARALLLAAGVAADGVDEILEELASEPLSTTAVLPGQRDKLGELLDRLAFETAIDLDAARRALLDAWMELSRRGPGSGPSIAVAAHDVGRGSAGGVAQAIAEFDRKRKTGVPIEQAFSELESELSLEEALESEGEELTPAPDFPGVVGAVIEEFLWESEREIGTARASELACLRSLGRWAAHVGVFENLSARDLLSYLCVWLPENDEIQNADGARRLLAALQAFSRWVDETQGLALHAACSPTLQRLQESLPRLAEANRRRTRRAAPHEGELFECVSAAAGSRMTLRDRKDREHEAGIDAHLLEWLRPGDYLRGRLQSDGDIAVYGCYPAEMKQLMSA
jgi:hypothetical protein